jgi:outer membrane protein assembly factor BamB
MDSVVNHFRETSSKHLGWNRLDLRVVVRALVLVAVLLAAASCGGSSAKSSSTKNDVVPRDLYIINANTGAIDQDFPDVNVGDAAVAAISDGSGGWYIGGGFSRIGEVRRNGLARLRSDGSLDEEFAPRLPRMAAVTAIVRHGKVVFAGGVLSGKLVSGVAAFDATSGRKLWQVSSVDESGGSSLAFASGSLFVGGAYKKLAGIHQSGLAALDPKTGKPTSWHVHLPGSGERSAMGVVGPMSIENGTIYFGGGFVGTRTARESRGLGAVSVRTGEPTAWNPRPSHSLPDHTTAILATRGQVLVGGMDGFVVYDAHTGRTLPWRKRIVGYPSIFSLSGNTVYLGARYNLTSAGGKPTHNLAAVELPSGRATNWRPMVSPTPNVTALAVSGQNVLMAG